MLSMTKRFLSLSIVLMLMTILTVTFTSTASAAPARGTTHTVGAAGHSWTRATARNFRQLFPHAHAIQTKIGFNVVTCLNDTIQSYQNSNFVSTEIGYSGSQYGMLRARASAVGPWEKYTICIDNTTSIVTIQAQANGLFVSTEIGYLNSSYAMLRARASVVGPWEQYFLNCSSGSHGFCFIQSKANGLFVAEEDLYWGSGYGMLRARTTPQSIGTWEEFIINAA